MPYNSLMLFSKRNVSAAMPKLIEDSEMLWMLKEMEYVEKIAEKINFISVSGSGQVID